MRTRAELHEILCEDLGCGNCYFTPPSSIKMKYPCIVYEEDGIRSIRADDLRYLSRKHYNLLVIDECPDSAIATRLFEDERLKYLSVGSTYVADGLYHYPFGLYF